MNRYIVVDFKENVLYSMEKVELDFPENEEQTSSITCVDKEQLIEELEQWIKELKGE